MKNTIILILIVCLVIVLPAFADDAQKENDNRIDAKIKFGIGYTGQEDSAVKVREYSPIDEGLRPFIKALFNGNMGSTFFRIFSKFNGDVKDMSHQLDFDFNRVLKQEFVYDALYHRLDHDPLMNIDVISEARSGAYVEDMNPDDEYYVKRTEFVSRTALSVPMVPGLKFYVHYRDEHRNGMYQARTLSKCSACHVVAQSRSINSYNRDIVVGADMRIGRSKVDYSYTANQFRERESAPQNFFLKNQHPELSSPVFTSRIGVGDNEYLPFDNVPESKKGTHLLKAAVPLDDHKVFSAHYVSSRVENVDQDLEWNSNAFAGSFTARMGKKAFVNALFSWQKISNDSVFVNINERPDIGGPNIGKTYPEVFDYLDTFDWTRYSSLSRTELDFKAGFRYKFSKKFKLRLGFDYEGIDREYFEVLNTKKSTFTMRFTLKPADKFSAVLDGKFSFINDPFANLKGGISEAAQLYALPSPLAPTAVQFYTWHLMRQGTMTNFPERVSEFKGRVHWNPTSKFALNANVLFRSEENDNLVTSGASWNREMMQWGVDLWAMLSKKMYFSANYYDYSNVYSTMFAIAALEGCGGAIIGGMTGTLTDMMDLDNRNQTLLLNLNFIPSKKVTCYLNFNYSTSGSVIKELELDESRLPYLPGGGGTALNFDDYGDTASYSKIDIDQMIAHVGANVMLSENWWLNGSIYYYIYDDLAEYLFTDTSGKSYSFNIGVTWKK